jgi:hypothetical protein
MRPEFQDANFAVLSGSRFPGGAPAAVLRRIVGGHQQNRRETATGGAHIGGLALI